MVRRHWLELFDLAYSMGRVVQQEIEPGVHAVLVPARCRKETARPDLLDVEIRVACSRVPGMARGLRMTLDQVPPFVFTAPAEYRGWMGTYGKDIAAGETGVIWFVDLAFLEAALLARLWDHEVLIEFGSPIALFRRGALIDYVNVHDAVSAIIADGRSLADTADVLAPEILHRLQRYANAYLHLTCLYSQAAWQIDRDTFVLRSPAQRDGLALHYWQLRGDDATAHKLLQAWQTRIDEFLQPAAPDSEISGSYAA